VGYSITDGFGEWGEWGNRVCVHNFFIPAISPRQAQSRDVSHSTGKKRVVPHFYGDGKRASEGVVVGMVSGLANTQGWTSVGCYFVYVW